MPRPKQFYPAYRRHKASGQAVVTLNGVDFYLGPHGSKVSRDAYDRHVMEWVASGRSPSYGTSGGGLTILALADDYLNYVEAFHGTGPNSELHRLPHALRPLLKLYGSTEALEFGPTQFKAVRQVMIEAGHARSFINANMKRIVRMFRWAVAEGKLPPAIPQTLAMIPSLRRGKTEAREAPPVLPADDAVVDETLKFLPEVVADMVRLQRLTGMRPGELCILRPCDIDQSNAKVWIYTPSSHKTAHHGHERRIFIGPQGQKVLLPYLDRDPEDYCFRPCDSEARRRAKLHAARKTSMSCGNRPGSNLKRKPRKQAGERYDAKSYAHCVRYALEKAFPVPEGLTTEALAAWKLKYRWSPNKLRHAAATRIRKEFGLEAAQVVLGHSRADVTQVYAERDIAKGIEVARISG